MAIALTPFRGFCGFLPLPQLLLLLSTIPEMRSLIGEAPLTALAKSVNVELSPTSSELDEALVKMAKESVKGGSVEEMKPGQKEALKGVFEVLMKASESSVKDALKSLLARYTDSTKYATQAERDLVELVKELNSQFPDDVGVLCCFILNVVELEVGKSVFLKADEPHAYISGGEWNDGTRWMEGEEAGCGVRCCRSG
jgi:mannose-6-phosphate isomerase